MKLTTRVEINKSKFPIHHKDKILSIGSCFAQNIGDKLKEYKFDIIINPTGIIYNPISLSKSLHNAIKLKKVESSELIKQDGRWVHYDYHSKMSTGDKMETAKKINEYIEILHQRIVEANVFIISLGTAYVYSLNKNDTVVCNCHKQPARIFNRKISTVAVIKTKLSKTFEELWNVNPSLEIIIATSPIRHTKDGLVENNRSKSTLLVAMHELVEDYNKLNYFPSYEILLDELRDYRFYEEDMVHPSKVAVNYIWSKFSEKYFSTSTLSLNNEIKKINMALAHKPFNPTSEEHLKFVNNTNDKLNNLLRKHPYLKNIIT